MNKPHNGNYLALEKVLRIRELDAAGASTRAIAAAVGCSKDTVTRYRAKNASASGREELEPAS